VPFLRKSVFYYLSITAIKDNIIKFNYLQIKDLIALPYFPDFSSPSWGLNGFREYDLFYLESINSKFDKQFTALTVAKEIAHNVCIF